MDSPVADLSSGLWRWPGRSERVELLVARPLLMALADEADRSADEIAGFLFGRHYKVRSGGRERDCVIALDFGGAEGDGESAGLEAVGWFRSLRSEREPVETEGEPVDRGSRLSEAERDFFEGSVSEPHHVAFVIDPDRRLARFYVRDGSPDGDPAFDPRGIATAPQIAVAPERRADARAPRAELPISDGMIAALIVAIGLAATVLLERSPALVMPGPGPAGPTRGVVAAPDARLELLPSRSEVKLSVDPDGSGARAYWVLREGPLPSGTVTPLAGGKPLRASTPVTLTDSPRKPGAYRYLVLPLDAKGAAGQPWDSAALGLIGRQRAF